MTITVDNASSNDIIIAFMIRRFTKGLICNGEYILNLIICDALKDHDESISRIRNAIRYVRYSLTHIKKCVENERISYCMS